MLQEEQISKLTKLKELLDSGVLSEEEFAQEKAKVMAKPDIRPHQPEPATTSVQKPARETPLSSTADTSIGPANVNLSSGIVLPLGIIAIIASLISAIFTGLANTGYYDYWEATRVSSICDFLALAAELIIWICAFNKLSMMPEGNRLGRIPLWTYLYLGALLLISIVFIAAPYMSESPLLLIILLAALAFGYMAFISMYKAYTGKMRTYSLVWMIGMGLSIILALVGGDLISTIIGAGIVVFLMIALLEKNEAKL